MTKAILPDQTLGILGGGQLGRMTAMAAKRMGYRVHVYDPAENPSAAQVVDEHACAEWDDQDALEAFAASCDRVTLEWENIPLETARWVDATTRLLPGPEILAVAQDRSREKTFLAEAGCPLPDFRVLETIDDVDELSGWWTEQRVIKTSASGYDGKGQIVVTSHDEARAAFEELGSVCCVAEAWVAYEREVSVLIARGEDSATRTYGPIWNEHANHILDVSVHPSGLPESTCELARALAHTIAERLNLVGILCVEMFVLADGGLNVNELAPRPHNSGHLTIEACVTSQFEQHVRAVCGLPLGEVGWLAPAAMANLLGELWEGGEPDWSLVLAAAGVGLHLYGKCEPRTGRKMGHLTALGDDPLAAADKVREARRQLGAP
ncbi:5-(carboxyamino)imidazole ribonucleotide synthase [Mucisphaera calidilacus]|uniref:N5-carboxyaminoimidazole ribonucleotide synthase n=1 Tax=Mucisphaera calidilacus TaxID=2527982 RepID=A0A518C126_9BACT|nr:5-(carboxyamino)imidazole ribonucleotide synthase [Mucisphaera calidilacus]QDU72937.1 N5-carboxyaminoimidazole ribonucleotide synthase [Mucisphaera calidilacus]